MVVHCTLRSNELSGNVAKIIKNYKNVCFREDQEGKGSCCQAWGTQQ